MPLTVGKPSRAMFFEKTYKDRMPDKEMINRLVKEKLKGEINENYFRGNVVLNITDIDVIVQEI